MTVPIYACEFTSVLRRVQDTGGWVFAPVPDEHAPHETLGWGRTPVLATVDGQAWETSVWRSKNGNTELAIPRRIRGSKDHGDEVHVRLEYSIRYRA